MGLQAVRAVYKGGTLIFTNPELTPKDGTEVMVTYLDEESRGREPPGFPSGLTWSGERGTVGRATLTNQARRYPAR
jgi:hypothetical protein